MIRKIPKIIVLKKSNLKVVKNQKISTKLGRKLTVSSKFEFKRSQWSFTISFLYLPKIGH